MRVSEICREGVVSIRDDQSVLEAARKMRRYHVGDLIVTDHREAHAVPVGILTDRDIVVGVVAMEITDLAQLSVSDVLSGDTLITATYDDDVDDAIRNMQEHGVRRLPVLDERGVLMGIFTLDDAVRHLSEQLAGLASVVATQQAMEHANRP